MPRHGVVERSRIAFSMKIFLETAPVEAAISASSWKSTNAGGPARTYVSWDRGTKRHAPVPVRPYLFRFDASLASSDTPVPQAAGATAEGALGRVTHTSTTTGRPGRYRRRSPRWVSRWERDGSCVVPVALAERAAAAAAPGGAGGSGAGGGALAAGAAATAAPGAAAAFATAVTAAAEASPGATVADCPAAAASPVVGGAAEADGTGG